jgi:hypothetical protein
MMDLHCSTAAFMPGEVDVPAGVEEEVLEELAGVEVLLLVEELPLLPQAPSSTAQSANARNIGNRLRFICSPLWVGTEPARSKRRRPIREFAEPYRRQPRRELGQFAE